MKLTRRSLFFICLPLLLLLAVFVTRARRIDADNKQAERDIESIFRRSATNFKRSKLPIANKDLEATEGGIDFIPEAEIFPDFKANALLDGVP